MFKRKRVIASEFASQDPDTEESTGIAGYNSGTGIPVGVFNGYTGSDQHAIIETFPGAVSKRIDPSAITFARYQMGRGIYDVQLLNGWQRTNYGRIENYRNEGYLSEVMPQIPGQSRLFGTNRADFVMRGPAPSQWQANVAAVNQQPATPGGPGQVMGSSTPMGGARG